MEPTVRDRESVCVCVQLKENMKCVRLLAWHGMAWIDGSSQTAVEGVLE